MRWRIVQSIWFILVLSVLSSSVCAGTLGDLTYEIADGQVAITDCRQSAEGELVIPAEIEGFLVTSIGWLAFLGCSSLTSITIPEGVTSIRSKAFSGCSSLTSIAIPDAVTSIGDYAFRGCSSLTSITIGDSVTSIGSSAFGGCSSLTSITIPEGVTSIGWLAFDGCTSLTSVTIPQTFFNAFDADRLGISKLWPSGFRLPPNDPRISIGVSKTSVAGISIQIPIITLEGEVGKKGAIEFSATPNGPWQIWKRLTLEEGGTTEAHVSEYQQMRFYRFKVTDE